MQYNIVRKCQKTRQKSIKIYTGRKTQTTKAAVPDFVAFNDTRSANDRWMHSPAMRTARGTRSNRSDSVHLICLIDREFRTNGKTTKYNPHSGRESVSSTGPYDAAQAKGLRNGPMELSQNLKPKSR